MYLDTEAGVLAAEDEVGVDDAVLGVNILLE